MGIASTIIRERCGVAAAALLASLLLISQVAAQEQPSSQEGNVVSAGAGKLAVKDDSGKEHSHQIDQTVKITINGKPGKLEDLQVGARVRIISDKDQKVVSVETVDNEK